ncbi:MAG TPA: hypothetical protein VIW69_10400 [Candidatus Elarobacter sp.]
MPTCIFELSYPDDGKGGPAPRAKGQQFTISMVPTPFTPPEQTPPFRPGCQFHVLVDGTEVHPGDNVGDFHCVGLGASGTASFELRKDNPTPAKFEFKLQCENCGPTTIGVVLPPQIINLPPKKGCLGMLVGPIIALAAMRPGS